MVLAQKNPVAKVHRRKEAIKEVKRLFEAEEWEELSRALLPDIVVDKALDLAEFWWRVRVCFLSHFSQSSIPASYF